MYTSVRLILIVLLFGFWLAAPLTAIGSPEKDLKHFQNYFKARFPQLELNSFGHGIYAINEEAHTQWESFEDFPPYEDAVKSGKQRYNTPFNDGQFYADCFPGKGPNVRQHFPRFNTERGDIDTLEVALNRCRVAHGEPPMIYGGDAMLQLTAYLAYASRGETIHVEIPDDPRAMAAYEAGQQYYYSKRGQLNMSCAGCHVQGAGMQLRGEMTSPALGQTSHFPVYRLKWGGLGSLHKRFAGCNKQIRSAPLPLQSQRYRELEYFLSFMSNGIQLNGPAVRQ